MIHAKKYWPLGVVIQFWLKPISFNSSTSKQGKGKPNCKANLGGNRTLHVIKLHSPSPVFNILTFMGLTGMNDFLFGPKALRVLINPLFITSWMPCPLVLISDGSVTRRFLAPCGSNLGNCRPRDWKNVLISQIQFGTGHHSDVIHVPEAGWEVWR